jgi:hypothetical protein
MELLLVFLCIRAYVVNRDTANAKDASVMDIRDTLSKPAYDITTLLELVPMSRSWVYSEISAGKLRPTKAGRRTIFLVGDVADWLLDLREAGL